ncbi:MAG: hypothetical protein ACLFSG_08565 [Halothiobacillaceae bacterium]
MNEFPPNKKWTRKDRKSSLKPQRDPSSEFDQPKKKGLPAPACSHVHYANKVLIDQRRKPQSPHIARHHR